MANHLSQLPAVEGSPSFKGVDGSGPLVLKGGVITIRSFLLTQADITGMTSIPEVHSEIQGTTLSKQHLKADRYATLMGRCLQPYACVIE